MHSSTEGGTRSDTSFCHKFSLELHMLMCHNTSAMQASSHVPVPGELTMIGGCPTALTGRLHHT